MRHTLVYRLSFGVTLFVLLAIPAAVVAYGAWRLFGVAP